jgi:hypothetical protein
LILNDSKEWAYAGRVVVIAKTSEGITLQRVIQIIRRSHRPDSTQIKQRHTRSCCLREKKRWVERIVRDITFKVETKMCSALKVLKQYSFVLLEQVLLREGKALGSGKGKRLS